MNDSASSRPHREARAEWAARLGRFLAGTPQAMAAEWDDAADAIELATVGRIDEDKLRRDIEAALTGKVEEQPSAAEPPLRMIDKGDRVRLMKIHGCAEFEQLWSWRRIPWPSLQETAGSDTEDDEPEDWRLLAALAVACGVLGIIGHACELIGVGPAWLPLVLYILAMIAGGWDAACDAVPEVLKGHLDIHFLMLAVALGATVIGAYKEAVLLLFLFSFAGALEQFALSRTRREIQALFRLAPVTARAYDPQSGRESMVPIDDIRSGDVLLLRPGDTVPVDAEAIEGESAVDESSLTGEVRPIDKSKGDALRSGTLNLWGTLVVRCLRPARESSLQQIIRLIRDARSQRAKTQRFIDRYGPVYTKAVLVVTAVLFFFWWLVAGVEPLVNVEMNGDVVYSALYRAMTLLVVASPCALVISIPSAILAAIAWGARNGILFKGGAAVEDLERVKVVAFDKTGTLTTGELEVEAVESFPAGRENDVLAFAAALESRANHPIAKAIVQHARANGIEPRAVEQFASLTGLGVTGAVDGEKMILGSRRIFENTSLAEWAAALEDEPPGTTEVWLYKGQLVGRLLLRDAVRPTAGAVIRRLRDMGIRSVMLTGDREPAAAAVAGSLGIEFYRAELTPALKVQALAGLRGEGQHVAMVGDGINDAPVLAAADVAFGMGQRGSDASLEQSDVVLMSDRIENIPRAIDLSRRAKRIIVQNVTMSLGTIAVMVLAAVFGLIPIAIGVLAHEGSTVVVCLNSMRLLRRIPDGDRTA